MAPNEMTSDKIPWKDAIIKVLQDAVRPLHYRDITRIIGERGLKPLSGATPDMTVNRLLHSMLDPNDSLFDDRIHKTGKGIFRFMNPDTPSDSAHPVEEPAIDDEKQNPNNIAGVPAYGLCWEKDQVKWNSGKILGRKKKDSPPVNSADQQGVYLLHNGRSVVYVGRAERSLYARLREHSRDPNKWGRWDCFSWFGFRNVKASGQLEDYAHRVDPNRLIGILEAVLIEVLQPPVNARRGDFMGILYTQVTDPEIVEAERRAHFQRLAS